LGFSAWAALGAQGREMRRAAGLGPNGRWKAMERSRPGGGEHRGGEGGGQRSIGRGGGTLPGGYSVFWKVWDPGGTWGGVGYSPCCLGYRDRLGGSGDWRNRSRQLFQHSRLEEIKKSNITLDERKGTKKGNKKTSAGGTGTCDSKRTP